MCCGVVTVCSEGKGEHDTSMLLSSLLAFSYCCHVEGWLVVRMRLMDELSLSYCEMRVRVDVKGKER